jgi:hypothetical protein
MKLINLYFSLYESGVGVAPLMVPAFEEGFKKRERQTKLDHLLVLALGFASTRSYQPQLTMMYEL